MNQTLVLISDQCWPQSADWFGLELIFKCKVCVNVKSALYECASRCGRAFGGCSERTGKGANQRGRLVNGRLS